MKFETREIAVRDVVAGYVDNDVDGVFGYDGKLDIRPAYQREFVYKDKKRDAVIESIMNGFPLNSMYWAANDDGTYELMDGQQRTVSVCQYVTGVFSVDSRGFDNLTEDERNRILDYRLDVKICHGSDSEKLAWFKTINIASEKLTDQELRNSVYTGEWLSDAKRHFSKPNCPAMKIGSHLMTGSPIRQDYLETVLSWIADRDGLKRIEDYMSAHQKDRDCNGLWLYFKAVMDWVEVLFPKHRREMKGVEWGILYNRHHGTSFNASDLEAEVSRLLTDDDVTSKKGIYPYVLGRTERDLSIRTFSDSMKSEAYERQEGICPHCGKHFEQDEMEADHITPWHAGGKTVASNCQMLCCHCNRVKSGK